MKENDPSAPEKSAIDRREFVVTLATLPAALFPLTSAMVSGALAPRVEAAPSIFYAPPDGRSALVRFTVDGSTAVAGRLRVFDRGHRQLGTAGMIGTGSRLVGELWLPLERESEVISELETPNGPGIIRTTHVLRPQRHWTLYWMIAQAAPAPAQHAGTAEPAFHERAYWVVNPSAKRCVCCDPE